MSGLGLAYSRHRGTEIDLQMVSSGVVLFEPCLTDYAEPFDLQVSLLGVFSSMNPGRLDAAVPTASATISATDARAQHCAGLTDAINPASRHV